MTGMLASVATLKEAKIVLDQKVDIIDLKNPKLGALGALDQKVISSTYIRYLLEKGDLKKTTKYINIRHIFYSNPTLTYEILFSYWGYCKNSTPHCKKNAKRWTQQVF